MQSVDLTLPAAGMDIVTGAGDRGPAHQGHRRRLVGQPGRVVRLLRLRLHLDLFRRGLLSRPAIRTSQLLTTAGIFAVGFFMRPLGGWLFGWIADRTAARTRW